MREVRDVDVVADARAVGCRIIGPVNLALSRLAERDLEDVGDEVRLEAMVFAEFFARARGVEVAKRHKLQAMNLLVPLENFFEHQLGLAVRIDRALRHILRYGHAVGRPVGRTGGTEDKFLHPALDGGVGELEGVDDVVVKVLFRVGHGLAHKRVGREVHDGVGPGGLHGAQEVALRFGLAQNKPGPRIHSRAVAFGQIVVNRDGVTGVEEFLDANRADVTRAARDEDVHSMTE